MNEVMYLVKNQIVEALNLFWFATMLRNESYKAQGRECFDTMLVLHGSSGIGKTAIMKGFVKAHEGLFGPWFTGGVVKLNIPAMSAEDYELPVANHTKGTIDRLSPIKFPSSPCVIQADEINRYSSLESINAFTRIILDGDGSIQAPKGSLVVGCANSTSYAGAKKFPDHLISRSVHIYVTENDQAAVSGNTDYLLAQSMPSYAVDTFKLSPTSSKDDFREIAEYNMRSFELACYICKAADELETKGIVISEYVLRSVLSGAIGQSQANKLMKERSMKRLPSFGEVINNPTTAIIPSVDLDPALKRKYTETLISECDNVRKADKLATYLARLGAEYARFSIEALAEKYPTIKADKYI